MSNKHLHLLQSIYHEPASSNIHWREIESLLTHLEPLSNRRMARVFVSC